MKTPEIRIEDVLSSFEPIGSTETMGIERDIMDNLGLLLKVKNDNSTRRRIRIKPFDSKVAQERARPRCATTLKSLTSQ